MEETAENRAVRVAVVRGRARDNDGLHKRRGIWHYKLKIQSRWREFSTRTTIYREAKRIRQKALREQEEGRLPHRCPHGRQLLTELAEAVLSDAG